MKNLTDARDIIIVEERKKVVIFDHDLGEDDWKNTDSDVW